MPRSIDISLITDKLSYYNISQQIIALSTQYIFKTPLLQFLSLHLSPLFCLFMKSCLKLVALRVFSPRTELSRALIWEKETIVARGDVKKIYGEIIRQLKNKNKYQIIDMFMLFTSLLSRQFLHHFLQYTKQQPTPKNELPKIIATNKPPKFWGTVTSIQQQQPKLLVEQYTFIILIYQTTGNLLNPHTFIYLKNKLLLKKISHTQIQPKLLSKLKHIKQHLPKKQHPLHHRSQLDQHSIHNDPKSIPSISDHHEILPNRYHQSKYDYLSFSLHQTLNKNYRPDKKYLARTNTENNLGSHPKISKIRKQTLSIPTKYRQNFTYHCHPINLQLYHSPNRASLSSPLAIKITKKPKSHHRNKSTDTNSNQDKNKERINWSSVVTEMKKQFFKPEIQVEKFTSNQLLVRKTAFQLLPLYQNKGREPLLDKNKIWKNRQLITFTSNNNESNQKYFHTDTIQNQLNRTVTQQPSQKCQLIISYKFNSTEDENKQNLRKTDINLNILKKKVVHIKEQKKKFQEKCRKRKAMIDFTW